MNISIIGGGGRMGRWLTRHFTGQGQDVTISDIKSDEAAVFAESVGAKFVSENKVAVTEADLTVVSTPMPTIPQVLREISPHLREKSILVEISSLKSRIIPVLTEMRSRNVKPLSIHPLFGPGVQRLEDEKIALVPLVDPSSELELVKNLFPGVEVIVVDAEEHDRAMALTLSLPHFVNILFASTVSEEDLNILKKLGGTTFKLQLILSESVMSEDPELYASIQMNNDYTVQYLDQFLARCRMIRGWIAKKDEKRFMGFYDTVRSVLSRDEDFLKSYERMYKVLEMLQHS